MKIHIVILMGIMSIGLILASENKKSDTTVEIKPSGAVTAFNKEDGFKLSEKAMKNLGISFNSINGNGPWAIPKSSLVRIKHSVGVYRKWDGWITMVLVDIIGQTNNTVIVKSLDLEAKDEVAITGVSFLRMTEADLNSDTVDACAH